MTTINESNDGKKQYLIRVLLEKAHTITRAAFWKIKRSDPEEGICLKIGRYKIVDKANFSIET